MVQGERGGHGWWPYLLPYFAFLVLVELARRTPDAWGLAMLAAKPLAPLLLIGWFFARGAYPELRGFAAHVRGLPGDVAVGLASAALWVVPYLLVPALRPASAGFDPAFAGAEHATLALALRFFGYACVTPLFEELFVRSFVLRVADALPEGRDFRSLPVARYTARSFWVVTVIFTLGHAPWEYWVCVPWIALTNLWFYRRGHLGAPIVVHAVANASILLFVLLADGRLPDGQGGRLSLWFFV